MNRADTTYRGQLSSICSSRPNRARIPSRSAATSAWAIRAICPYEHCSATYSGGEIVLLYRGHHVAGVQQTHGELAGPGTDLQHLSGG